MHALALPLTSSGLPSSQGAELRYQRAGSFRAPQGATSGSSRYNDSQHPQFGGAAQPSSLNGSMDGLNLGGAAGCGGKTELDAMSDEALQGVILQCNPQADAGVLRNAGRTNLLAGCQVHGMIIDQRFVFW